MSEYVPSALFVYTEESEYFVASITRNTFGVDVTAVPYDSVRNSPEKVLQDTEHVVVSGSLDAIKEIAKYSIQQGFSLGVIPLPEQKMLTRYCALPEDLEDIIELSLRNNPKLIDLVICNEKILFFKATIGEIPLIDNPDNTSSFRIIWNGLKRLTSLKLTPFTITADGKKQTAIDTAASGCMIIQHHKRSIASRLIAHDSSPVDGMISLVVVAPFSVVDYIKFFLQTLFRTENKKSIPTGTGYIKSPQVIIDSERSLDVKIDGESVTTTPLSCSVIPGAIQVNLGDVVPEREGKRQEVNEQVRVNALPAGKELLKAKNRKIPFFAYASEERFKDLFLALREDASLNTTYLVLMVLSTVLATIGLYLDSSSVIIGAMLLAPLMAPIVSIAMAMLRNDKRMFKHSWIKICVGVGIALFSAAFITFCFSHKPVTGEMQARLNPTVLDLIVAIAAGIAGAYTKSHKEILQSLAGVAIAVALVPPLAVSGIGIGRMDPVFFSHAFLLFSTNLVGIVLSAFFTFRILGYAAAVKSKRGIGVVAILLVLISVPLYLSYNRIVETSRFERSWQVERFLVNGKYLIVKNANLEESKNNDVLTVDILAREQLSRSDLSEFKRKVRGNFSQELIVRANITYIP